MLSSISRTRWSDGLRVFVGFDSRQPLAYTVARASIERHAKGRVQVEPLRLDWLPITRRGLTEFTYSRFLVPWLCAFKGQALFVDADVIARADVRELCNIAHPGAAVSVVQGALRFEWASVMVFQCDNFRCRTLTPAYIDDPANGLFDFAWASDRLGALPPEWNVLVGYQPRRDDAKLVHFTAGIPCWEETRQSDYADWWWEEFRHAMATVSWEALMGRSVHRAVVESGAITTRDPRLRVEVLPCGCRWNVLADSSGEGRALVYRCPAHLVQEPPTPTSGAITTRTA